MASLFVYPSATPVSAGSSYASSKLYFYRPGTTTLITVYSTSALDPGAVLTNPVVASATGVFAPIWIDEATNASYRMIHKTAGGATISDKDNLVAGVNAEAIGAALYPQTAPEAAESVTPADYTYPPYNLKRYCVGDGVANDTAGFESALAAAVAANAELFIPAGTYLLTANITVPTPANVQHGFTIRGEGKHYGSILKFSGASVTTGLTFDGGASYQYWGTISGVEFLCASGAKRALYFTFAHAPKIVDCQFNGATEIGLNLDNCNAPAVEDCLFLNNGSATHAQLALNRCTAFRVKQSYIGDGNASILAGISIDRCNSGGLIDGGVIESSGISILIANATESTYACRDITITGLDLEAPGASYIKAGYGWSSGNGVNNLRLEGVSGSVSGGTPTYAVDLSRCQGVKVSSCSFRVPGTATAVFNLASTLNLDVFIGMNRAVYGNTVPFVYRNGAQVREASPLADWHNAVVHDYTGAASISSTTATLENRINANEGGLYSLITITNASPQTINATAAIPSKSGHELTLLAADANSTLAHAAGGNGQFINASGANVTLASGGCIRYVYNANTGNWVQL